MKKILLYVLINTTILSSVIAQAPAGYYSGTAGLSGYQLKNKLHKIISKKPVSWNYDRLPYLYESTDRDIYYENDNSLLDIYSENPTGIDSYNYYYEIPSLISGAGSEGLGWNREHLFSQSFFYSNYPMYSDMHFIVPTDARVNQRRSNLPFGKVGTVNWTSLNGSKVGLSATPGYTLSVFEPIDEFKGDIARMLLYVALRYETLIPFFQYDNGRCPFEARQEKAVKDWQIALLKEWHNADPVSYKEIDRNNDVFTIQKNRNPFIDHPEWVEAIWPSTSTADSIAPPSPIYLTVDKKGKHFVSISWDMPPVSDILGYEVYKNDSIIEVVKDMKYTFTDLDSNTNYSFKVRAYDFHYNYSTPSFPLNISTSSSDTFARNLIISKVIHGTSENRAFELYNRTGYDIDLRHYYLTMRQINSATGTLYWSSNGIQMEGSLPHNKKLVIMHPNFNLPCSSNDSADILSDGTPMRFDGILAVSLRKDNTDIDLFGIANNDSDSFAYHKSFYRKNDIIHPNTTFTVEEWIVNPTDYCDSLGYEEEVMTSLENESIYNFSFYPNPTLGDRLYFTGTQLQHIEWLSIVNINGVTILNIDRPFSKENYIDISMIPAGFYIINTPNGHGKFIKK